MKRWTAKSRPGTMQSTSPNPATERRKIVLNWNIYEDVLKRPEHRLAHGLAPRRLKNFWRN
jgi:hypothetical protein